MAELKIYINVYFSTKILILTSNTLVTLSEKHLEHIKFTRIRPRIRVESNFSAEQIRKIISKRLDDPGTSIEGTILSNYGTIFPKQEDQHYWSPQLTFTIEETQEECLIEGLYGPQPTVWTMFVFFYAVIGFVALIISMIGLSYWSLGKSTSILWLVPLLILLFMSLYLVAYLGQKIGHRQMINLHHFMEECLGKQIDAY